MTTEAVAAPLQLEAVKTTETPLLTETRSFTRTELLNKGEQFHTAKDKSKLPWAGALTPEDANTFDYLGGIQSLKEASQFSEGSHGLTAHADGRPSNRDIKVVINGKHEVQLLADPKRLIQNDETYVRLMAISGRQDGYFHIITSGKPPTVSIPEETFYEMFMETHQASLLKGLSPSEQKAAQAYFEHQKDPAKAFDMDRNVLIEAAKSSGKVFNESLQAFMDLQLREQKAADDDPQDKKDAIDAYNKERNALHADLGKRLITTPADMARVMALYGPAELASALKSTGAELVELEQRMPAVRGTEQEAVVKAQIADKNKEIERLKAAAEIYNDPQKLTEMFTMLEKGTMPAEVGQRMNDHLKNGKMLDAVQEMIGAKFDQLDEKKQKEILEKARVESRKQMLMMAGGGILGLLLLIFEATKGNS